MVTRHQIQDLYVQGADFEIPAKDGEVYKLYMRKLNPVQQQVALRKANAARIRTMQILNKPSGEDDDLLILEDEIDELGGREGWLKFLIDADQAARRLAVEQELATDEKWDKDGLLQGLYDAWDEDMQVDFAKGPDERSPESQEVYDQLSAFAEEVDEKIEAMGDKLREELELLEDEELRKRCMKMLLERDAGIIWVKTYRDYQVLYGVEDRETGEKLYDEIEQVKAIPPPIYGEYMKVIGGLNLAVTELKS